MDYLIKEFGEGAAYLILLLLAIVVLYIFFVIIKAAIKEGTAEQRRLLERQNELLSDILKNKG